MMLVELMCIAFDEVNTSYQSLNAYYDTPRKRSHPSTRLRQSQRSRHISQHLRRHQPRQQRPPRHHPSRPALKHPISLRVQEFLSANKVPQPREYLARISIRESAYRTVRGRQHDFYIFNRLCAYMLEGFGRRIR